MRVHSARRPNFQLHSINRCHVLIDSTLLRLNNFDFTSSHCLQIANPTKSSTKANRAIFSFRTRWILHWHHVGLFSIYKNPFGRSRSFRGRGGIDSAAVGFGQSQRRRHRIISWRICTRTDWINSESVSRLALAAADAHAAIVKTAKHRLEQWLSWLTETRRCIPGMRDEMPEMQPNTSLIRSPGHVSARWLLHIDVCYFWFFSSVWCRLKHLIGWLVPRSFPLALTIHSPFKT